MAADASDEEVGQVALQERREMAADPGGRAEALLTINVAGIQVRTDWYSKTTEEMCEAVVSEPMPATLQTPPG